MKITLTLCDKDFEGNIPQYEFENTDSDLVILESTAKCWNWLQTKDFDKSVFVCFENYRNLPMEKLRNEQFEFLISHDLESIDRYCIKELSATYRKGDKDFAVFEFESYEEAFKYCIDLKEGF